jgi:hypothetical protein
MNNVDATQNRRTNWGVIPGFAEFIHLCEAILDQGSDELCHLSDLGREVGDNSCDYPEL